MSQQQCEFQKGFFHENLETCSQVDCLSDVCGLVPFVNAGKHSVAIDIEKLAGWLRMFFIYSLSGLGGWLTGALFTPYQVCVCYLGNREGMCGGMFVELFQSWPLLARPWREVFKLTFIALVAFAFGFLPYLDNWSHLGGFTFGVLSSIVFLPYITFGKWDAARKRTLIFICLPGIVVLMTVLLSLFFTDTVDCSWCHYLNCINFTDNFCEDNLQDIF
ncbi:uncharacterized protein MONBRDRAFT_21331 [Monosiga brevicollis MX1]|uniref:Peptidase S54 rhomboid domain-containing protein n=1 Tax=Monosiga brevicollis TaxID=81824 RepID=A9UUM0_MONBE|nr:uncharacterized protein MONBRDRAFT_21331 [Monosiga brevicollis MX1]EDQ91123.1 predicted protein [Monosiga brevicollis MX1]|eukprot:XP_001744420.1 hypothetical protein [Monosiga brevicollis MX1]